MNDTVMLPRLTNLSLRDGQQSTLDSQEWVLDTAKMTQVLRASSLAGYTGAEVAGGQSFQTAISNGYNPFTITDALSNAQVSSSQLKELDLQMLFRGANALGFRHYDKDVVEATLNEFIKNGVNKIRFFDALNDVDNLFLPESVRNKEGVILQAAMCFGHYAHSPERYTDDYYVNYLKVLMAKGFNSFAIKDMSGQMTPERIKALFPLLKEVLTDLKAPLELHLHSTNEEMSKLAIQAAIEVGVDSIETVEGPLCGGSAHHDLASVSDDPLCHSEAYKELTRVSRSVWGAKPNRKDADIPEALKKKLCDAGVPGGAMPFVIRDLKTQSSVIVDKYKTLRQKKLAVTQRFKIGKINEPVVADSSSSIDFEDLVELFICELKRVCIDAGLPLLVTPTADICAKQAISNLAFSTNPYGDSLEERYLNRNGDTGADPRFTKLVLGHYGEFKAYNSEGTVYSAAEEVLTFFEKFNPSGLKRVVEHPSLEEKRGDMRTARAEAWGLIRRQGCKALSFANFDQLSILYALKPVSAPGVDPVMKAVSAYAKRADSARIGGRGITFTGFETMMQPIIDHLSAMFAADHSLKSDEILQETTRVRNMLTNLISSDHTSDRIKLAAGYVGQSFENLDFRPANQTEEEYIAARERFKNLNVGEVFGSLAVLHSMINSVDKHGTNPVFPAERAITMEDIGRGMQKSNSGDFSAWETKLNAGIRARHYRVETTENS